MMVTSHCSVVVTVEMLRLKKKETSDWIIILKSILRVKLH